MVTTLSLPDFFQPSYLSTGTIKQATVYHLLQQAHIFDILRKYSPCLAGTIPLKIDTAESDADILCEVRNHKEFQELLHREFGHYSHFQWHVSEKQGLFVTVASFMLEGITTVDGAVKRAELRVEIFGQNKAVKEQNGYRHLVVESRFLALADALHREFIRDDIRLLKLQGVKTEPAFAQYFGVGGNPYQALLDLYSATNDELVGIILQKE